MCVFGLADLCRVRLLTAILFSALAYLVRSDTKDEYSKGIFSETPLQWLANGCYCPLICNQWGRHVLLTPTDYTFKLFILNSCFESLPSVHFVCHCNLALGTIASSEVRTGPPNYRIFSNLIRTLFTVSEG